MGGLPEAEKARDVTDAGRAGGVNGVAVGSYAGGTGDGRVGDEEEFARTVERSPCKGPFPQSKGLSCEHLQRFFRSDILGTNHKNYDCRQVRNERCGSHSLNGCTIQGRGEKRN